GSFRPDGAAGLLMDGTKEGLPFIPKFPYLAVPYAGYEHSHDPEPGRMLRTRSASSAATLLGARFGSGGDSRGARATTKTHQWCGGGQEPRYGWTPRVMISWPGTA